MQRRILCQSAGWVLFSDGPRLVFADRGTSHRRVLLFVMALLAVIAGVNGIVWLRMGEMIPFGIGLIVVAGLAGFEAWRVRVAEQRDRKVIPEEDTWVAVLHLETQTFETSDGEVLAPLSSVRFAPTLQLGSSSRALAASWPAGSRVVYRGSPFAGGFHAASDVLRDHGVDAG